MPVGTMQALAASFRQAREASITGDVGGFERHTAEQARLTAQLYEQPVGASQAEMIAARQGLAREVMLHRHFIRRARMSVAALLQASSPNSGTYPAPVVEHACRV